jgi:uncharacterized OsmC-like protein
MNADEPSPFQSPVTERYREDPKSALVTLKAQGRVGDGDTCKVKTGIGEIEAGPHRATGGNGLSLCAGDMLLESLVACAGVTLRQVATALKIDLRKATVTAEGELDFRGTLGVSRDALVGFETIRLHFDLDTDAGADEQALLVGLTERYCVVKQSLNPRTSVSFSSTAH